ncbi:MAG: metal-dependent transcriptional regulator [Candidatus Promineifilaceae bacterium]
MIDHNTSGMSESEEMYLVTITSLVERGESEPVPISRLAEELSILPVSANQMVHKLVEEDLVSYLPYRGVELTPRGKQIAQRVLRQRRLWEVFLVEHLGVSAVEADALACRFEHITPSLVTDQLDDFLGFPPFSPQGLPIPEVGNPEVGLISMPLAEVSVGDEREIVGLYSDDTTSAFLDSSGIRLRSMVTPLAITAGGDMLVLVEDMRIQLAADLTRIIRVQAK